MCKQIAITHMDGFLPVHPSYQVWPKPLGQEACPFRYLQPELPEYSTSLHCPRIPIAVLNLVLTDSNPNLAQTFNASSVAHFLGSREKTLTTLSLAPVTRSPVLGSTPTDHTLKAGWVMVWIQFPSIKEVSQRSMHCKKRKAPTPPYSQCPIFPA
jgi:hypothetical protein